MKQLGTALVALALLGSPLPVGASPFGLGPAAFGSGGDLEGAVVVTSSEDLGIGSLLDPGDVEELFSEVEDLLDEAWEGYERLRADTKRMSIAGGVPRRDAVGTARQGPFEMTMRDSSAYENGKDTAAEVVALVLRIDARLAYLLRPVDGPDRVSSEVADRVWARAGELAAILIRYDTLADWTGNLKLLHDRKLRLDHGEYFSREPARAWNPDGLAVWAASRSGGGAAAALPEGSTEVAAETERLLERMGRVAEELEGHFNVEYLADRSELKLSYFANGPRRQYVDLSREFSRSLVQAKAGLARLRLEAIQGRGLPAAVIEPLEEAYARWAAWADTLRVIQDRHLASDRNLFFFVTPPPRRPGEATPVAFPERWMPPRGLGSEAS